MANPLRIKRGTKATIPTLAAGEPGFCTDTFELFIGTAASGNKPIGGMANPMSAAGDTIYGGASGVPTRLAKGTAYQHWGMNSGATAPEWQDSAKGILTAAGDLLYASAANTLARLAKGTAYQSLNMNSGATVPAWMASLQSLITEQGDVIYGSAANTPATLAHGTSGQVLTSGGHGANPLWAAATLPAGSVVQVKNYQTGASSTGTTVLPRDDTIPQITEGDQFMSLAITPTSATNNLFIEVVVNGAGSTGYYGFAVALFSGGNNALAVSRSSGYPGTAGEQNVKLNYFMAAGTTNAITFTVRCGDVSGTFTFNGSGSARLYGAVLTSSITITEIKA